MGKAWKVVGIVAFSAGLGAACGESDRNGDDGREPNAGDGGVGASSAGTAPSSGAGGDAGSGENGGASGADGSAGATAGNTGSNGGAGGASAGGGGDSGAATAGVAGAAGASGGAGGSNGGVSGSVGMAGSPPEGCTRRTERIGFASPRLFIAMDRSASLLEPADETDVTAWELVTSSLATMLQDPASAELGVALRFFPHDQPSAGCSDPYCSLEACAEMLVPMGTLTSASGASDPHEAALVDAMDASAPQSDDQGGTPLYPALYGALEAASQHQVTSGERATVLLVTDGSPNGCIEDGDELLDLAASWLAQAGVATYVIGLPGVVDEAVLEYIAQFGGSQQPLFVPNRTAITTELVDAFSSARDASSLCGFDLPPPYAGSTLNYDATFLQLTTYGAVTTLPRVGTAADCGSLPGFTVEDTGLYHRVELCPASCEAARAPGAVLDVLLDSCPSASEP